jgi:ubiquinone biosynthesis monooxygenase Coq7
MDQGGQSLGACERSLEKEDVAGACLTVLYDGSCPLCRREIAFYQDASPLRPIEYVDISADVARVPAGLNKEALMARFHVQKEDGSMASGASGFVALWEALPGWRWLARMAKWPGATPALEGLYGVFLRLRPAMQRAARALEPDACAIVARVPHRFMGDLRSDHAGELGAVYIYKGVLACASDPELRSFAQSHLVTEQKHLALMESWVEPTQRSRLLGVWRVSGWLVGALPALCGPRAVYATIEAVETFVDKHYQAQIDDMAQSPEWAGLRADLEGCRQDEVHHKEEAQGKARAWGAKSNLALRAWCALVGHGSEWAVRVCRRV